MDAIALALSATRAVDSTVQLTSTVNINTEPVSLLDPTVDSITTNAIQINSRNGNDRLTYLMERLTTHLHEFARETRLTTEEWMAALEFLVECGKISDDNRQELVLLCDVLGLSLLIDAINHPKPPPCTEGFPLGYPYTHDTPPIPNGAPIAPDPNDEPLLFLGKVKDSRGHIIPDVRIDVWEAGSPGSSDLPYSNSKRPTERCFVRSNQEGKFWFKGVKPVGSPIPNDGPVGRLLRLLKRDGHWRPAHLQFKLEKEGFDPLITALYIRGDPHETTDASFGLKQSLAVDLRRVDERTAERYGIQEGAWLIKYTFVLATIAERDELRDRSAVIALSRVPIELRLVNHLPVMISQLPVPDLD